MTRTLDSDAVEALGVVRELVDGANVEHLDRAQWLIEHAYGFSNRDNGWIVRPYTTVDESVPVHTSGREVERRC